MLKELRFELSFDDPRKAKDQQVTIQGNGAELEMLSEAVNNYVQNLLESSAASMSIVLPMTNGNYDNSFLAVAESSVAPSMLLATQESAEALDQLDNSSSVYNFPSNPKLLTLKSPTLLSPIYLQPKGLVTHNLFLGQLATQESGPVVELTVLQLFDLATALDQYAMEVVALPTLSKSGATPLPPWASAAAAVVLAVGLTTAGVRLLEQSNTKQEAAAPAAEKNSPTKEEAPLLTQVPPAPTPTLVPPSPPTASPKLLPPPPVTPPPAEENSPAPVISDSPPPVNTGRTTTTIQPKSPAPSRQASRPSTTTNSTPNTNRSGTSPRNSSAEESRPKPLKTAPPLPNLPPLQQEDAPVPEVVTPVTPSPSPITPPPGSVARSRSIQSDNSDAAEDSINNDGKLFDAIPQVKEIRDYLQQRWQPPAELTQILEYQLVLSADGSIQRIIPLGQAAATYIDRTSIPKVGEPFVSPVTGEGNPIIRVVLKQDGQVETFLE